MLSEATKKFIADRYYWELVGELGRKAAEWQGYLANPYIPARMVQSKRNEVDGLLLACRSYLTTEYPGELAMFEEEIKHYGL